MLKASRLILFGVFDGVCLRGFSRLLMRNVQCQYSMQDQVEYAHMPASIAFALVNVDGQSFTGGGDGLAKRPEGSGLP